MRARRIILPVLLSLCIAYLLGIWFDARYKHRWQILFFNKTDELILAKDSFDVVLMGNSRVHFGINPYYLDSVSGMSSFNFANGGTDMEDILLTSKLFLEHHPTPKLAVISLDAGMLKKNESLKTLYHYLFYLKDSTMRKFMKEAGHPVGLIRAFPFVKYMVMDEYNRISVFNPGRTIPVFDHNQYRGYLNVDRDTGRTEETLFHAARFEEDTIWKPSVQIFEEAINTFQHAGTTVVFVYPPEKDASPMRKWNLYIEGNKIFDSIAVVHRIPVFRFNGQHEFSDSYFVDNIHLNNPGATRYSIILGDSLRLLK